MLFVQVFVFHVVVIDCPERFIQCTTYGSFNLRWQETLYNMLTFTFLFLLPLFIMISCYSRILFEISKKMTEDSCKSFFDKNICNGNFLISLQVTWPWGVFALTLLRVICHANVLLLLWSLSHLVLSNKVQLRRSKNNIPRARMRTLKMTVVIVLSFMVCWTPYYMLGLWYWFCPAGLEETVSQSLSHILFTFGLLNACLDPIIYGLFTIPLCMRHRQRERNIVAFELENTNNSLMTSIRTSTSSLTLKRMTVQQTSREKLEWDGEYVHRIGDDGAKNSVAPVIPPVWTKSQNT